MYKIYFSNSLVILTNFQEAQECRQHPDATYRFSSLDQLQTIVHTLREHPSAQTILIKHTEAEVLFQAFQSLFQVRGAAGGLVQNPEGHMLVIKRYGIWDLPKGHIEAGEKPEETAVREVSEECGIAEPEIIDFLMHTYHHYVQKNSDVLKITHWYLMHYPGAEAPKPQEEEHIEEVKWVSPLTLEALIPNTYPSLHGLFRYPASELR